MSALSSFILGLIIGWITMSYLSIRKFRERVNAIFRTAVRGEAPRAQRTKELVVTPASTQKIEQLEQCIVCKKYDSKSRLQEANVAGSKGKLYIHTECCGE